MIQEDGIYGCSNSKANVLVHPEGVRLRYVAWPTWFDPVWVIECNGFLESGSPNSRIDSVAKAK